MERAYHPLSMRSAKLSEPVAQIAKPDELLAMARRLAAMVDPSFDVTASPVRSTPIDENDVADAGYLYVTRFEEIVGKVRFRVESSSRSGTNWQWSFGGDDVRVVV